MRLSSLDEEMLSTILDRLHTLETASPMFATSMTSGRFRIGGSAVLLVDSTGGMSINGSFAGTGTFNWTGPTTLAGSMTLSGPMSITGTQTVTGTLNVNGPWNLAGTGGITGAVACTGNWTWTGILTVNAGGSIVVGGTIPMTLASAAVGFSSGGQLIGYATGVRLTSGSTPDIVVSTGGVSITGGGGPYLTVSAGGHFMGAHKTTTSAANAFLDSTSGLLSRVTSAARFKIDAQPMDLPDALLDVPVKDWIDRGQYERDEMTGRIPGVIAEEVEAAGGAAFVTYDDDGQIEGVAYDRLALARTQILSDRLERALARIEALEEQLAN
jgi:hypothetical protein